MDSSQKLPRPPDTDSINPWLTERTTERITLGQREFLIDSPAQAARLVEHPAVQAAFASDEYLPYWAQLWPGATMLSRALQSESWAPGTTALELGCGLGLPGIVALSVGLRVTFSDYDETALCFASANARANGFNDFDLLRLDWREPPPSRRWKVILAADVVYEPRNVEPLCALIRDLLEPDVLCLLADQERVSSTGLQRELARTGLAFSRQTAHAAGPDGRRVKGHVYRIRKRSGEV